MERIRVNLTEYDEMLMIPVPRSIGELMGWNTGDILAVPFHEIEKIPIEYVESPQETGKKEVNVKIRTHEPKKVTQSDVIELLEKPTQEMKIYRTTYIKWKGKTYGVKNICKVLLGHSDFNTQTAEKLLNVLGFPTFKR